MLPTVRALVSILALGIACERQPVLRASDANAGADAKTDERQPGLRVSDAYAGAGAKTGDRSSIFLVVENTTNATIVIRGVQCDGFASARFEESVRAYAAPQRGDTGSQRVRHVDMVASRDSVTVSPGQRMDFDPMGTVIALTGLERPLAAGQTVSCRFETTRGVVTFGVRVR